MTGGAGGAENLLAQGDQTKLKQHDGLSLPDGDYLISVTSDTFKIDGEHFTVPLQDPGLIRSSCSRTRCRCRRSDPGLRDS